MFVCKIENTRNQILTLSQNEENYQIINIMGLTPPSAQINTSKIAGQDGSKFNSSTLNERNIVITVKLNGDVEQNRINLYSFFRNKEWCKFYYKNGTRNVYIEGYVESLDGDLFSSNETMQISILCPNPYFKDIDEIIDDISKALAAFEFPFAIDEGDPIPISTIDTSRTTNVYNNSESETGLIIEIDLLNNANKIQINNIITGEIFVLNYAFLENDKIIIDTNKGNKSVSLVRNAVTTNLFTAMRKGSSFFQLNIGDNFFSYLVDEGTNDDAIHIVFKHYTLYGGV